MQGLLACLAVSIAMGESLQSKPPFAGVAAAGLGALGVHGKIHVSVPCHMPTPQQILQPQQAANPG